MQMQIVGGIYPISKWKWETWLFSPATRWFAVPTNTPFQGQHVALIKPMMRTGISRNILQIKQTNWNSIPIPLIKNLPNSMKPDRIEEKIDLRVVQTFVYAVYMQQDTLFKTLSITGKPWNKSVCKLPSLRRKTFTST